jgi:hypothetical protein
MTGKEVFKRCNSCGKEKPLTEFHGNGRYKGTRKYKPDCRHCTNYKLRMHLNSAVKEHFGSWKCSKCGFEGRPIQFDCHHVRGEKKFSISQARQKSMDSKKIFKEELEKCDLLCANCHRLEHEVVHIERKLFYE